MRWRTTPGSLEPGANLTWAIACSAATFAIIGAQPSAAATACRAARVSASSEGAITATTWLGDTVAPTSAASAVTTPAHGAVTEVSIFMALITISVSPAETVVPTTTEASRIVPPIGASIPSSPSPTGSAAGVGRAGARRPGPGPLACSSSANAPSGLPLRPPVGEASAGFSASRVVRASPAATDGSSRMARSCPRLVGKPAIWNSPSAAFVRATAEARVPDEFDRPITLANIGSNCGGGARPA